MTIIALIMTSVKRRRDIVDILGKWEYPDLII
jgi:hypothetical protein